MVKILTIILAVSWSMAIVAKVDGELFAQAARGARPKSHEPRDHTKL